MVEVKYNNAVIASLEAGQTATLQCNSKKMVDDVIITAPEVVDNPLPIEVETEIQMNTLLLLETTEVGAVYKYTGATTARYESGALYVVEKTPITFTVGNKEYQADEGMLWEDWLLSDYNTDGFTANGNYVVASNGYKVWWTGHSGGAAETFIDDTITSDYYYQISQYNPAN